MNLIFKIILAIIIFIILLGGFIINSFNKIGKSPLYGGDGYEDEEMNKTNLDEVPLWDQTDSMMKK